MLRVDGSEVFAGEDQGDARDAGSIGAKVGQAVLQRLPPGILAMR